MGNKSEIQTFEKYFPEFHGKSKNQYNDVNVNIYKLNLYINT